MFMNFWYDNFLNIIKFFPLKKIITLVNVQVGKQVDLLRIFPFVLFGINNKKFDLFVSRGQ